MPSSQGCWEDSIQLINAPQVPCVVHGTEEMAGGVVVEQGSKEFKQMVWTRHGPCLGTSASLLRPSQIPCRHKMAYGKPNSFAQISFFASAFLRPFHDLIFSWLQTHSREISGLPRARLFSWALSSPEAALWPQYQKAQCGC